MDEPIDIYNEHNEALNMVKMRSEAHMTGLWHRSAHIWVYNDNSELLLQLRSGGKKIFPNMWDISSAGHIGAGEKPLESAIRELEEEIGISTTSKDLQFYKVSKQSSRYNNLIDNEFHYVYFLKFNADINNLTLQKEEVRDIRFCHINQLLIEITESPNNFVPHGNYWFDIISELRTRVIN